MKIYLLNTLSTGLVFAELLVRSIKIEGIITVKKRTQKIYEFYDYESFCYKNGIRFVELNSYSLDDEDDKNTLENIDIDIIITSAWQRIVPQWLLDHCKIGGIGIHGSASGITAGRGRSPQNWALIAGAQKFSVSIFWLSNGIDDGEIIDTKEFVYSDIDDISISYEKESICIVQMLVDNLHNGNIDKHFGIKQVENGCYLPKRIADDGLVDWNRTCKQIYNFVRALSKPYPCAFTLRNEEKLVIEECKYIVSDSAVLSNYSCGEVVLSNDFVVWVRCNDGIIEIRKRINNDFKEVKTGELLKGCLFASQIGLIIERHNKEVGLPIADMIYEMIQKDRR